MQKIKREIRSKASRAKAKVLQRFFKTGKGQYGEGDRFLGITVPESRKIAIKYKDLASDKIKTLLQSKFHEERLIALLILVHNFQTKPQMRRKIFDFYLKSTKYVNNWDLVDLTADKIVGQYLFDNPKKTTILNKLAISKNLWDRRIAVIATFQFIKNNKYDKTLKIAKMLLSDKHDLIHKAVGWMLREVGKRSLKDELRFLRLFHKKMARTTLRYAIERFPEKLRKSFLNNHTI